MTRPHRSGARTAERVVRAAAALTVLLGVVLALTPAPGALAINPSKGRPRFCKTGTGVTVVIDFQQLGGTVIVRCDPQVTRGTGLDALKNAGGPHAPTRADAGQARLPGGTTSAFTCTVPL